LDVLSLWGELVTLPDNIEEPLPTYLPKVQCPNPAHDTHKYHFQINTRKPFVHCFARCGISGSYEHAVAIVLGLRTKKGEPDVKAARRVVLRHTRIALGSTVSAYEGRGTRKSHEADSAVAKDQRALDGGAFQFLPREARNYLDSRGISAASRGKWQIGWHEDEERIVIPAYDERGIFRFLIKRSLQRGSFKYLYTDGCIKQAILFGACYVDMDAVRSQGLILCEGSLDVIRLHQLGVKNAVAILGSGISAKQVRLIDQMTPRRVYLFFDKDSAGVDNIADAKRKLTKCPLLVCRFPKHRDDPAEMSREEVERSLKRALPMHKFDRIARKARPTKEAVA
jgi:hypothetical protein